MVHGQSRNSPFQSGRTFVAGDRFVVQFEIVADKASKERMQMSELGIYTVKDSFVGKPT
jgi:hypothetical protein